jgi:hypothetical protein
MAQVNMNYIQALWKLPLPISKGSTSRERPPLRQEISIQNTAVIDLSPQQYWITVPRNGVTVTVIMGSLLRDRIAEKSCVLYESILRFLIVVIIFLSYYLHFHISSSMFNLE